MAKRKRILQVARHKTRITEARLQDETEAVTTIDVANGAQDQSATQSSDRNAVTSGSSNDDETDQGETNEDETEETNSEDSEDSEDSDGSEDIGIYFGDHAYIDDSDTDEDDDEDISDDLEDDDNDL